MSHCGLDDRDGSLILDALVPSSSLSSSGSGSCRINDSGSSSTMLHSWMFLDLSCNTLEGGAALCAAALISAVAGRSIDHQQQHGQQQCGQGQWLKRGCSSHSCKHSSNGGDSFRSSSKMLGSGSIFGNAALDLAPGCRVLLLDGNPLGASGVRSLMRALAGQPSVGLLLQDSSSCGGTSAGIRAPTTDHDRTSSSANASTAAFFLATEQPGAADTCGNPSLGAQSSSSAGTYQQQQGQRSAMALHVGIAKVALMAKEKGFRSSMRDTQSASMLSSQVGCTSRIEG